MRVRKIKSTALLHIGAYSLLTIIFGVTPAGAQTPSSTASETTSVSGSPSSPETADIAITSKVTAREVRFNVVPNSKIEFSGSANRQTGWITQRRNIPRKVQPGVTYRNVGVNLQITSSFSEIERLVSDILGEPSNNVTPPLPQETQP